MCWCRPEIRTPYCSSCPWKMADRIRELEADLEQERIISSDVLRVLETAREYRRIQTQPNFDALAEALAKLDKPTSPSFPNYLVCNQCGIMHHITKPCGCKDKPTCATCMQDEPADLGVWIPCPDCTPRKDYADIVNKSRQLDCPKCGGSGEIQRYNDRFDDFDCVKCDCQGGE